MTLSAEDRTGGKKKEREETVEIIIAHVAKNKGDKKAVAENAALHSVRHCKVHRSC